MHVPVWRAVAGTWQPHPGPSHTDWIEPGGGDIGDRASGWTEDRVTPAGGRTRPPGSRLARLAELTRPARVACAPAAICPSGLTGYPLAGGFAARVRQPRTTRGRQHRRAPSRSRRTWTPSWPSSAARRVGSPDDEKIGELFRKHVPGSPAAGGSVQGAAGDRYAKKDPLSKDLLVRMGSSGTRARTRFRPCWTSPITGRTSTWSGATCSPGWPAEGPVPRRVVRRVFSTTTTEPPSSGLGQGAPGQARLPPGRRTPSPPRRRRGNLSETGSGDQVLGETSGTSRRSRSSRSAGPSRPLRITAAVDRAVKRFRAARSRSRAATVRSGGHRQPRPARISSTPPASALGCDRRPAGPCPSPSRHRLLHHPGVPMLRPAHRAQRLGQPSPLDIAGHELPYLTTSFGAMFPTPAPTPGPEHERRAISVPPLEHREVVGNQAEISSGSAGRRTSPDGHDVLHLGQLATGAARSPARRRWTGCCTGRPAAPALGDRR